MLIGKMMPALGLAMLMQVLAKKSTIPFILIGFALAAYLKLDVMAIAIIGTGLALLHYYYMPQGGQHDGTNAKKKLSKKTLRKTWFAWQSWGQICYNYERMMGLGFAHAMSYVLEELYPNDKDKLAEGLTRELTYYNTENTFGSMIAGIVASLEEKKKPTMIPSAAT